MVPFDSYPELYVHPLYLTHFKRRIRKTIKDRDIISTKLGVSEKGFASQIPPI